MSFNAAFKFDATCLAIIAMIRLFEFQLGAIGPVVACAIAAVCVLFTCWRAAHDDDGHIFAAPVTGILLVALLDGYAWDGTHGGRYWVGATIALTIGIPVVRCLARERSPTLVAVVGALAGAIGVAASLACVAGNVPVFSSYVGTDELYRFNPLQIGHSETLAQETARLQNNGAPSNEVPWILALQIVQVVAAAAWDALLLSVGVWVAGALALLPLKLVDVSR